MPIRETHKMSSLVASIEELILTYKKRNLTIDLIEISPEDYDKLYRVQRGLRIKVALDELETDDEGAVVEELNEFKPPFLDWRGVQVRPNAGVAKGCLNWYP